MKSAALFTIALTMVAVASGQPRIVPEGEDFLLREARLLNRLLQIPTDDLADKLAEVTGELVDFQLLTKASFGGYCESSLSSYRDTKGEGELESLVSTCLAELSAAYRHRVFSDFAQIMRYNSGGTIELRGYDLRSDSGNVRAQLSSIRGNFELEILVKRNGHSWKIADLIVDEAPLSRHYRKLGRRVTNRDYSHSVLLTTLGRKNHIVLEDFSSSAVGELPPGWGWRDRDDDKQKPYKVSAGSGRHFLAAQDSGGSVILLKFAHWNPREFPILTWCWRVNALPPGGDERYDHTNDSAAGLYVNFSTNWIGLPKYIKYVWSTTLPVGTVDRRKRIARPWFFVVESGEGNLGKWIFEKADLTRDYARVYSESPAKRTIGLGILTDANSTKSVAHADYADIRAWTREADVRGEIYDHCTCHAEGTSSAGSGTHNTGSALAAKEHGE